MQGYLINQKGFREAVLEAVLDIKHAVRRGACSGSEDATDTAEQLILRDPIRSHRVGGPGNTERRAGGVFAEIGRAKEQAAVRGFCRSEYLVIQLDRERKCNRALYFVSCVHERSCAQSESVIGASSAYRPVEPEGLVRSAVWRGKAGRLLGPTRAEAPAAPWVSPNRTLVGLHSAIGPAPLLAAQSHVSLDLDPIGSGSKNGSRGKAYRKCRAVYGDCRVYNAVNWYAGKPRPVSVNEDIPTVGWPREV
jgi:hypothetical protein